jgi:predicted transcriptional regulator of viral defense system/very-short-patch-repair endonuclease
MGALGRSDRLIAALSAPQHGVVARSQLLATGVTRRQIAARLDSGRLHRMHRGVYAVGHRPTTEDGLWLAAVLACGARATLSHRSAGALRGLTGDGPHPAVTTPRALRPRSIEHHRATLSPADRTTVRGIAVTSVARTLVDLAHILGGESLERAVREAQFRGWWHERQIRDALTRRPSTRLRAYLGDVAPMQSTLEERFLRLCARHRIPRPLTQQGRRPRLDFVWPRERVVVEVDGWEAHRTRAAFQRDRTTTNALQLDGFLVLRFTWEDVNWRPALVAAQVRRALGLDR